MLYLRGHPEPESRNKGEFSVLLDSIRVVQQDHLVSEVLFTEQSVVVVVGKLDGSWGSFSQ